MDKYKHLTLIKAGKTIKQEEEACNTQNDNYYVLIKLENEILVKRIEYLESQIKMNRVNYKQNKHKS